MPSSSSADDLYKDDKGQVTASWLVDGHVRYAIRTVVRLDYKEVQPVRTGAIWGFCAGLLLVVAGISYPAYRDNFPPFLANSFWVLGLLMSTAAALHLYFAKPVFKVYVTLLDGSVVKLFRARRSQAQGLLQALTDAMDYHRNGHFVIDASRASHVKKRFAMGKGGLDGPSSGSASNDPFAGGPKPDGSTGNVVERKRQQMRRLMPMLSSLFKDRD